MDYFWVIFAYFLGSIPFGLLLTKFNGHGDIRQIGSGNIGATNVLRTGNKWLALTTLILDALKGLIAVSLCKMYAPSFIFLAGLAAIIGHIFPVWLKFKGGKGIATALGVFIPLNYIVAIALIMVWITVAKLTKISSLSALIAVACSPLLAYLIVKEDTLHNWLFFTITTTFIVMWTHRDNIKRLIQGQESTIKL